MWEVVYTWYMYCMWEVRGEYPQSVAISTKVPLKTVLENIKHTSYVRKVKQSNTTSTKYIRIFCVCMILIAVAHSYHTRQIIQVQVQVFYRVFLVQVFFLLFFFRSSYFSGGVFLLCSRTRYASTWFAYLDSVAFGFSLSHCDHIIWISPGLRIRKDTGGTADVVG